jgi:hypothetical protein
VKAVPTASLMDSPVIKEAMENILALIRDKKDVFKGETGQEMIDDVQGYMEEMAGEGEMIDALLETLMEIEVYVKGMGERTRKRTRMRRIYNLIVVS